MSEIRFHVNKEQAIYILELVAEVVMSEELRRDLRLPIDCGLFDPIRQQWRIRASELRHYRPDLFPPQQTDMEDED